MTPRILRTNHQTAATATGNGTAAAVSGYGAITFQVTGTFTATVTFEATVDGSTWVALPVYDTSLARQTTATAPGTFQANISGYSSVRARVTWTSGTSVTVTSQASPEPLTLPGLTGATQTITGSVTVGSALPAGEAHLGQVGGTTVKKSGTITRPNDTNIYAAGDAVTNSTSAPVTASISGCARISAGSGVILNAMLIDSANQATAGSFEAWIFDTTITADNDNAVFTPTDAELATVVAIIPFVTSYIGDATSGAGGNRIYTSDQVNRGFVCAAASTTLYWALVARNAYTPVADEAFTLRMTIVQD